jgi:hypothetical protein
VKLVAHAATPAAAEALMNELLTHYQHATRDTLRHPRIGMLNYNQRNICVERIPVTAQQIVPRDRVDLYYRDGASTWVEGWIRLLSQRRYGLTVLTGHPGTGKTTLLRSLAHWLAESHILYFMSAARFTDVQSGEIVAFWVEENRHSPLRKLLVLEDAESVVLRRGDDNREKVGTLLNLTDGMLGDALGLHVICTLNSELAELDPALLRPGRLVAHRDFDLLTRDEARRLAELLGLAVPPGECVSLAELFNHSHSPNSRPNSPRRAMGFHTTLLQN